MPLSVARDKPEPLAVFLGLVAIVLLPELSRRVVGNTFTLVVLGFRRGVP